MDSLTPEEIANKLPIGSLVYSSKHRVLFEKADDFVWKDREHDQTIGSYHFLENFYDFELVREGPRILKTWKPTVGEFALVRHLTRNEEAAPISPRRECPPEINLVIVSKDLGSVVNAIWTGGQGKYGGLEGVISKSLLSDPLDHWDEDTVWEAFRDQHLNRGVN